MAAKETVAKQGVTEAEPPGIAGETPASPRRGGRAKGVHNKTTRIAKEAILEAEPHRFLIRIMEGRKFRRAGSDGSRRTVDCFPTLEQSINAAQILLRKIAPDLKAQELSGPDGNPIRSQLIHSGQDSTKELARRIAYIMSEADRESAQGDPGGGLLARAATALRPPP